MKKKFGTTLEPKSMPKRVPPLSAKMLATIRPSKTTIELPDGQHPGLWLRILPRGTWRWSLNICDSRGVRRRFDVGTDLSLREARKSAEELRRAIREGADPTNDRRAIRQRVQAARQGQGTLRALLETYFTSGHGSQQRRAKKSKRLVQTVFARALNTPALDLTRTELQLVADGWRSKASASLAVRVLRPCLKWAERRGLVAKEVADLEQPGNPRTRERVLSSDELRAIWPHLNGAHGNVFKWLLWTGCRLNEAAGMTWGEIQADNWTIPASRTKNGRQRTIPLPSQALELLRGLPSSDTASLVFPSRNGGVLSNWDRESKRIHARSGTSCWHRHDLRRTVATMLGDLGVAPHLIRVVLGHAHVADGATGVYARSRYQAEHHKALQALADQIERLTTETDNVVRLAVAS
jgi:integrase